MALPVTHPLDEVTISCNLTSVVANMAGVMRAPFRGKVVQVGTVLSAPVTTADATVTTSIGATAITGGAFVITQSGSAIGDHDSANPTAANICQENDVIKFVATGSGTAGVDTHCYAVIRRA